MTKKKNIQASNQNLINSQDGLLNSLNEDFERSNVSNTPTNDFERKKSSDMQPGVGDTKGK